MSKTAIVGSQGTGICGCHPPSPPIPVTGQIISGSPDVKVEGQGICRIGDVFQASCGHTALMASGSPDVKSNDITICRVGDPFSGAGGSNPCASLSGTLTTGTSNHNTN